MRIVSVARLAAMIAACFATFAQSPAVPEPARADEPAPAPKSLQFAASLDGFADVNFNHPASGVNALRNFDTRSDAFRISTATLSLQHTGERFGFRVDAGAGETYKLLNAADPWQGPNRYLAQYYVSYKPIHDSSLQLDFGKFYTSVGAETAEASANFQFSRSLVFALGEPYYHFGLRAAIPVTKSFTAGAQVLNGWNNVWDNNRGKTLGFTAAVNKSRWSWSQAYLTGPEKSGTTEGRRHLYNSVVTLTPRAWATGYVEGIYGAERRIGGGSDRWYGVSAAAKLSPFKKVSVSPRVEWYADPSGFTSGMPQKLRECTLTAEYRRSAFLAARLEYRRDWSDHRFFDRGAQSGGAFQQNTILLGFLLTAKAER